MIGRELRPAARFVRERALHRSRPDDVYISSYPRSGTTWLQQVLWVLANDGERPFAHIDDVVPWFERSLALGTRSAADFARMPGPRLFKSHLPFAWLPRGARYVYALRDGRDVAVSYYHLYRSHLGFEGDFDVFFERFLHGRLQYRSWFKHVAGWRALEARSDVCLVRYERMLDDLPAVMRELNDFAGFGLAGARIEALAPLCSFDHMKRNERRFDHATAPRAGRGQPGQFLRNGRAGEHRALLSAAHEQRFRAAERPASLWAALELDLPAFLQ